MAITSTHPEYALMTEDWIDLRDAYAGERVVKEAGARYLKPTAGQTIDGAGTTGTVGEASYQAYKSRAVFPDFFTEGVGTLVGILNGKDAKIELPPEMEPLRKKCTLAGEGLQALLRKIHSEQLITGRIGLLGELPSTVQVGNQPLMYLVPYRAEQILNWDDGAFNDGADQLNMVVLDETGHERVNDYEWKQQNKYRVLTLGAVSSDSPLGTYRQAVVIGNTEPTDFIEPTIKGQTLDEIPFVFIGSKDLVRNPDRPPLLGLMRMCYTIYRNEADYRQTLYMQGQDTLVVIGGVRGKDGNEALRVGAGARIDVEMNGDAKYIGVGSAGLPEMRTALENDRGLAAVRTGQLLQPGKMSMESGEALKTRVAAQTATLTSVAITACAGLEQVLRTMARWAGYDESKVKCTPNLDFTNLAIQGQDLVQIQTAKGLGAPIAAQTVHHIIRERGLTTLTFEEEMEAIKKDPPILAERAQKTAEAGKNLNGNNPQAQAGGPAGSVAGKGAKSNKPKE